MVRKHLVIAGAGEFGRELYWTIQGSKGVGIDFDIRGYIDDKPDKEKTELLQCPCLGTLDAYEIQEDDVFTCAVANPVARECVVRKLERKGAEFIDIIHETAIVHGSVRHGRGIILCPFSMVGDGSVVGDYVALNGFSGIGHDCRIGDFTCIMSHCNIMGHTEIGSKVFIGGSASMVPRVKIGDSAYVGAGSLVLRKVKAGTKVFGNPAVPIEF